MLQRVDERIDARVEEGGNNGYVVPDAVKVKWPSEVKLQERELVRSPADEVDDEQDEKGYGDVSTPCLSLL